MSLGTKVRAARKKRGWAQGDLAEAAGVSQQLISQLERDLPSAGKDTLPQIAAALDMEVTDLDPGFWKDHPALKAVQNVRAASLNGTLLPLFASARGGSAEMVLASAQIGYERHPLEGVRDGYAVYVVGDSMEPLFEQGDRVLVNPHVPPAAGSDVILQSAEADSGERFAMVKRLVRVAANDWQLQQFNPASRFKVSRQEWPICHVIVGKYSRR